MLNQWSTIFAFHLAQSSGHFSPVLIPDRQVPTVMAPHVSSRRKAFPLASAVDVQSLVPLAFNPDTQHLDYFD